MDIVEGNWPPSIEDSEKLIGNIEKRLAIESKKLAILEKKLEECKDNAPQCDRTPLYNVENEIKELKHNLLKAQWSKQIQSFKKGDILSLVGTRHHGWKILDFEIAEARVNRYVPSSDFREIAEVEIVEVRKDHRIVAKSCHGRTLLMGIPFSENDPMLFYNLRK